MAQLKRIRSPSKAARKRKEKRNLLWPEAPDEIWDTETSDGWRVLPRVLNLAMEAINNLGSPLNAGSVYLGLWLRDMNECFQEITDEQALAWEAGYRHTDNRAVRSWRERMDVLAALGFIRVKSHGARARAFVLLRDPHLVLAELHVQGRLAENEWLYIESRCLDLSIDLGQYVIKASTPKPAASAEGSNV
jgi:hypothetical protein